MKISTKTGDKGETGLYNGRRVSKGSCGMAVLGELDELMSFLGWCKVLVGGNDAIDGEGDKIRTENNTTSQPHPGGVAESLEMIQNTIYRIMSIIGNEMKVPESISAICEKDVLVLEEWGEKYKEGMAEIRGFVKPGKNEVSARFHVCRSVCRRAERSLVLHFEAADSQADAQDYSDLKKFIFQYVNRLSDFLFVLAEQTV